MQRSTTKRAVAAVAFAATLAGGAAVGAMLGVPHVSSAQEGSTTTTTAPATDSSSTEQGTDEGVERHGGPGFGRAFDLSVVAEVLGLTEDELRHRLEGDATLADVAEAEGVDVDTLIDALVAAGEDRIDEAAANAKDGLEDRITDLVEDGFPEGGPGGPGGPHGHGGFRMVALETAADAVGLTEDELKDRFENGNTLAEVAEAEGVAVDTVVTKLVAAATAEIDERVAAGDLDEDRAAELEDGLEERIRSFVEHGLRFPGRPGR